MPREILHASFIIVLNNDIEFVQTDFLIRLEDIWKTKSCHILGPDIIRRSTGEHQNPMDTRLRTEEEGRIYGEHEPDRTEVLYCSVSDSYWNHVGQRKKQRGKERKRSGVPDDAGKHHSFRSVHHFHSAVYGIGR